MTALLKYRGVLAVFCVVVYTFAIRTRFITERFWLYGDQVRDWAIALLPFHELPLTGPPSVAGGTALGPIFYWLLWLIRVTLGPWFDDLPHAGGIGLAGLQSAADGFLVYALWRRVGSLPAAIAIVILAASGPFDLALSATVWNPIAAGALSKVAVGLWLLWAFERTPWRIAAVVAVGWLGFQAHSSGAFVALGVLAWFVGREVFARRYRDAMAMAFGLQMIVLGLQGPMLIHVLTVPAAEVAPTHVMASLAGAKAGSFDAIRSGRVVFAAMERFVAEPWTFVWIPWLIAGCAVVLVVRRWREPGVWFMAVVPPGIAILASARWMWPFEQYWFLPLAPLAGAALVLGLGALVPARWTPWVWTTILIGVLAVQPARVAASDALFRLHGYGALVRASKQIVALPDPVRRMDADFLHPEVPHQSLVTFLGGRFDPASPKVATVLPNGTVVIRETPD